MKRLLSGAALAAALFAVASAQTAKNLGGAAVITESRLRAHLELVASDLLEGRDTPSRGQDIAATYVATQLKLWGVQPGGDKGSYFQTITISRPKVVAEKSKLTLGLKTYAFGEGFVARGMGGDVSGGLVFASHGIQIPSLNIDPYQGLDVKGKVVVVSSNRPKEFSFTMLREGKAKMPAQAAADLGAKAIIVLDEKPADADWQRRVTQATQAGQPTLGGGNRSPIPQITAVGEFAESLMKGEKVDATTIIADAAQDKSVAPFAMSKQISGRVELDQNVETTQNVIGIIPGSDPKLKNEYVAVGAHIDHVGIGRAVDGDTIYNGADDDGSGTVAILELAYAFSMGPKPKRSVIIVWHTGEEKGLWGSDYFTSNSPVPLANIVAQLNIDMIGRSKKAGDTDPRNKVLTGPDEIYIVGSNRLSKDLGDLCVAVNKSMYGMRFDYKYDDPADTERIYERSDHYNYAKHGIPIAFFFDGVHEDYHRPGDHVEKIDFRKIVRVTHTVYGIIQRLGNDKDRPRLNGPDAKPK